ncbi:hypothetical protein ACOSQ3_015196 [Xanthoceras sorbifolium]
MAVYSGSTSSVPSLPPPCPKSPPEYPDLYGKRRETAKVQMLEREIGFLEEELKSVEGLHPASRYCKEVADFVLANSDPLIPMNRKNRRSCRFWKWLCGMPCFNFSWISWICCCCCSGCSIPRQLPRCCDCNLCSCNLCSSNLCSSNLCRCNLCNCHPCACCSIPKCWCCSCPRSNCCRKISCSRCCCIFRFPSCPRCSCCQWKCPRPKFPKVRLCCSCKKTCCTCNPCCLFF